MVKIEILYTEWSYYIINRNTVTTSTQLHLQQKPNYSEVVVVVVPVVVVVVVVFETCLNALLC